MPHGPSRCLSVPNATGPRRVLTESSMIGINGRTQGKGEIAHLVARQRLDLSVDLSRIVDRDSDFKFPTGRGDGFAHGSAGSPDFKRRVKSSAAA